MQFLGKIIEALKTVLESVATNTEATGAKLDTSIVKLQGIIDTQYTGGVYTKASDVLQTTHEVNDVCAASCFNAYEKIGEIKSLCDGSKRFCIEIENTEAYGGALSNSYIKLQINGVDYSESSAQTVLYPGSYTFVMDASFEANDVIGIYFKQGTTGTLGVAKLANVAEKYDIITTGTSYVL